MPDLIALLPPGIGPGLFAILLATSALASLITVVAGIGGGGILLAVLASLISPVALIPVHGVIQIGSNAGRMLLMLRYIHWAAVLPGYTIGAVVGVVLGGSLVVNLPPAVVQVGVGLFIIYTVLGRVPALLNRWGVVTGAVSSFLTMFFGATGLLIATYTRSFKLERHAHVATHATLMTVQHGLKSIVFGLLGFAFAEWAVFIAAMIGAGLAGTVIGKRLLTRITDARFQMLLNAVLLLLSARLIWAGARDLSGL